MTIYVPADAAQAIKDWLPGELADYPSTRVGLNLPLDWSPSSAPALVVFDDGGGITWPITTDPTIRITVWSSGRSLSRQIAGHALGVLLCKRVPGVAQVLPSTSLLDARDSRNGGLMCSFTVRTRIRTRAL